MSWQWFAVAIPTVWAGVMLLEAVAEWVIESDYRPNVVEGADDGPAE